MIKLVKSKFYIIPWVVFALFLFMQYDNVYLYYDDFGYGSLSYGYNAGISGTEMNLLDVCEYTINSYFTVNGRIFTNFLLSVMAWLGGLDVMRLFMPACVLGTYLLIHSMVLSKTLEQYRKYVLVLGLCFSYGMFEISVCNFGLYWFAAAFGYVVPTFLFLVMCRCYRQDNKIILPIVAFLLCISSEQSIAMTLVFIVVNMIFDGIERRKVLFKYKVSLVMSFIASVIMVSSPASRNRMSTNGNAEFSSQPIVEKVFGNVNILLTMFFDRIGHIFVAFVLGVFMVTAITLLVSNRKNFFHYVFFFCTIVVISLWVGGIIGTVDKEVLKKSVLFLYFIYAFIEMFILYVEVDKEKASMVLAAGASLAILLFVPEVPERTFIPFMFMMTLFGADMYCRLNKKTVNVLAVGVVVPYMFFCGYNLKNIYDGYQKNAIVLEYNNSRLIEASDKIENDIEVEAIELYKLIDSRYGGQQAYDVGVGYMKFWMDEFYSLPFAKQYIYIDYPAGDNPIVVDVIED